jgi:MFS family permease
VAGVLFLLLFASGAASPLYAVYQARWRFSATTLTAVFGVYALVLLVTLLVFGSVSDYLGRRRVIAVALVAGAGACGLFLAAHGVGLLFAARALSGAAVGIAASAGGPRAGPAAAQAGPNGRHARTRQMTELTTVQAVDHHTAKLNGTWLYRAAAAQKPGVIYGSHVHPDLPGGTAQPSEGEAP